jgi:MinD superfamily P-loop ATPase
MKFIALFVIEKNDGEWMYKDMDESCGPCYYNCPLAFIAIAKESNAEPGAYAKTWREKVIQFHKDAKTNRDIKSKLVAGAKIKLYEVLYELLYKLDGRKGWSVRSLKDNLQYRMTAKQVNQSAVVG